MSTNLWRNRHNSTNTDESLDTVQFTVNKGIVGVDWDVEVESGESLSWNEYERLAKEEGYTGQGAWVRALTAIHEHMNENDLCYTRDASGQFYLGRVTGPWRYETDPEYKRHQLVNVRDCNWYRIKEPEETVPTELLESFGRGSVLQRIKDSRLLGFSQRLFEIIDDQNRYDIELPYTMDHWLSDDDLRDLLAIHLQTDGNQILIPSSVDQRSFHTDGIAANRITAERTLYQVQHQHDNLPRNAYSNDDRRIIYLQRDNDTPDTLPNHVQILQLEDLADVFENQWELLPHRLRIIGDVLRKHGNLSKKNSATVPSHTQSDDNESPVAAGFTLRNVVFLIAGFLLALAFMTSYGRWSTASGNKSLQQRQSELKTKINDLKSQNKRLVTERNELKKTVSAMKPAKKKAANEKSKSTESQWINVQIREDDTLSELIARFQGSQAKQNRVVDRNNLQDRDLIYTGSTLSFPSNATVRTNKMAQN